MTFDHELERASLRAPSPRTGSLLARTLTRWAVLVMPIPKVSHVRVERRSVSGVKVRLYSSRAGRTDSNLKPVVMWVHGGGYVIGHPRQDDLLCKSLAADHDCIVVSPDYRLAPRHPFPAALDDCAVIWQWLADAADDLAIDPERAVLAGQSAGAGLALGLALRARDRSLQPPRALWLFAPMLDDRTAARRELDDHRYAVWTNRLNRHAWRAYLTDEPGSDHVSSYAAPARAADLSGLPPTWIGVGDADLFHEEVVLFAERMRASGSSVEVKVVERGFHGFESLARRTRAAKSFTNDAGLWLRAQIGS